MNYGYIRVSTQKQDLDNQKFEIENFAKAHKIKIDGWIQETISGTKSPEKRKLGILLENIKKDDLIICTEISRLGRSLFMIMEILNACMEKEARVWTIKDNYRLGDDIQSKVLAFAFGLSAEIERNLISQRTKQALNKKKQDGIKLGRKKGSKNREVKLTKDDAAIRSLLRHGCNYSQIARLLKVDRTTLMRYITTRCPELAPQNRKHIMPELTDELRFIITKTLESSNEN